MKNAATWMAGALAILTAVALSSGCGDSRPSGVNEDGKNGLVQTGGSCAQEGATSDCSIEVGRSADAVSCVKGTRTCHNGSWGACAASTSNPSSAHYVVPAPAVKTGTPPTSAIPTGGIRGLSINSSASNCTDNPCDQYCKNFPDVPDAALTGDSSTVLVYSENNLTFSDLPSGNPPSGFTMKADDYAGVCGTCYPAASLPYSATQKCQEACQFDSYCLGNGKNGCQMFSGGQKNACTGIDVTTPIVCTIPSGATNAGKRKVRMCNRGSADIPANSGVACWQFPGGSPQYPDNDPLSDTQQHSLLDTFNEAVPAGECVTHYLDDSAFQSSGTESIMCNVRKTTTGSVTLPSAGALPANGSTATTVVSAGTWTSTAKALDTSGNNNATVTIAAAAATQSGGPTTPAVVPSGWSSVSSIGASADGAFASVLIGSGQSGSVTAGSVASTGAATWSNTSNATGAVNGTVTSTTLANTTAAQVGSASTIPAAPAGWSNTTNIGGTQDNSFATVQVGGSQTATFYAGAAAGTTGTWTTANNATGAPNAVTATSTVAAGTASTTATFCTYGATDAAYGGTWTNTANANSDTPANATATGTIPKKVGATNGEIGMFMSGPGTVGSTAVVTQVDATVRWKTSSTTKVSALLKLRYNGGATTLATTKAPTLTTALNASSVTWNQAELGTNLTLGDVANAKFLEVYAANTDNVSQTLDVDYVQVTVTYKNGTGGTSTIRLTNFGVSLPANASNIGVTVTAKVGAPSGITGTPGTYTIKVYKNGQGTLAGTSPGTTQTIATALTDMNYAPAGLTAADLSDANFAVDVTLQNSTTSNFTASVDSVTLTVTYDEPATANTVQLSGFGLDSLVPAGSNITSIMTTVGMKTSVANANNKITAVTAIGGNTISTLSQSPTTTNTQYSTTFANGGYQTTDLANLTVTLGASTSNATGFIGSIDSVTITVAYANGTSSGTLRFTNFGLNVPSGATNLTVTITPTAGATAAAGVTGTYQMTVYKNNKATVAGTSAAQTLTGNVLLKSLTSYSPAGLTAADLSDANFAIDLTAATSGTASWTPNVDAITVTVSYDAPTSASPLTLTGFGLDSAIPATATITSISTTIGVGASVNSNKNTMTATTSIGGTTINTISQQPTTTITGYTSSSFTNTTYTVADLANLAVVLGASTTGTTGFTGRVDYVAVNVTYSLPGSSSTIQLGGYGFSVPATANLVQLSLQARWYASTSSTGLCFQAYDGATALGAPTCTTSGATPTAPANAAFSQPLTITAADANNLSVKVTATGGSTTSTAYLDYVVAQVYYANTTTTGVDECNINNNWSVTKTNPPIYCPATPVTTYYDFYTTRVFDGVCPPGTRTRWKNFGWDSRDPNSTKIEFRFRSFAPTIAADGTKSCVQQTPAYSDPPTSLSIAHSTPTDTQVCSVNSVPNSFCPADLATYLGGAPGSDLECLQMDAHGYADALGAPTLNGWTTTYDCLPTE